MTASSLDPLISELRSLIANGDIDDAFERLLNYLRTNSSELYDDALAQSGRFKAARRGRLAGQITPDAANVEVNLVREWLLDFIGRLPSRIERKYAPVASPAPLRPVGVPAKEPAVARGESLPTGREGLAFDRAEGGAFEKILGINNLKQISWIERGVQVCKPVCRILTPEGLGTGFMVGNGMIMTNHHVVGSRDLAAASVVEFDYQQDVSNALLPSFRYEFDPDRFHTSSALDYTILGLKENPDRPLASWGFLSLNPNAIPVRTEHVSIVQHPNGGLKQIVLTANKVVAVMPPLLHYTTDTMPGSSGSPVFNDTWYVIAIHHSEATTKGKEGYANEGILMSAIKKDAGAFWPKGN